MSVLELVDILLHDFQLGWLGFVWLGFFLLYLFRARVRRFFVAQLVDAQLASQWEAMPERIIFMRHGESEGNVNRAIYARVPDSMLELTDTGRQQARDAGKRLQQLLPPQTKITVVLSPFERTQQTLLSVLESLHDHKQAGHHEVVQVHDDPRIREQEFGNLQQKKAVPAHGSGDGEEDEPFLDEAQEMGRWGARFYHRREKAESPADVYVAAQFCAVPRNSARFRRRARLPSPPGTTVCPISGARCSARTTRCSRTSTRLARASAAARTRRCSS